MMVIFTIPYKYCTEFVEWLNDHHQCWSFCSIYGSASKDEQYITLYRMRKYTESGREDRTAYAHIVFDHLTATEKVELSLRWRIVEFREKLW